MSGITVADFTAQFIDNEKFNPSYSSETTEKMINHYYDMAVREVVYGYSSPLDNINFDITQERIILAMNHLNVILDSYDKHNFRAHCVKNFILDNQP